MKSSVVRYACVLAMASTACSKSSPSGGADDGGEDASNPTSTPDASIDASTTPTDSSPQTDAATPVDGSLASDAATPVDGSLASDAPSPRDSSLTGDAGAAAVRRIGRFDLTLPSQPSAEWSASAMEANFEGTSVSVQVGGANNYFAVVIDGTVQPVLTTTGGSSYPLATGLAAGTHSVLVFRRDEAFDNPSSFVGFDFGEGGALLAPPEAPLHKIELIGDSISAGYGDECANASDAFDASTENGYIAYGPIAARALGADIHVIAWSGKGMYQNLDGTTTDTMPILWQRTIPTDASSHWDPSQWIPDAVVINLGTNDYGAPGGDPSADFETAYLEFATELRSVYPNAFIFCALGPLLDDPNLTLARTAINQVIAMQKTMGDTRFQLVEFPTQNCGSDGSGCGCDYHPNAATQQAMATLLESALHTTLAW